MKKNSLFIAILFTGIGLFAASASGIKMNKDLPFTKVREMAAQQNKFILLDIYAVWCAPCRYMDKYVLSDPGVGDFYNANYIACSFDAEKGEGIQLAKEYGIGSYPTFLIFTPAGELVHRAMGMLSVKDFIQLGKDGMNPETQYVTLKKQFLSAGTHTDAFLKKFCYGAAAAQDDSLANAAVTEYLSHQRNVEDAETLRMLYDLTRSVHDAGFKYLYLNRSAASNALGEENYNAFIEDMIGNEARRLAKTGKGKDDFEAYVKQYLPEKSDMLTAEYELSNLEREGNWKEYPVRAEQFVKTYAWDDAVRLNHIAQTVYVNIKSKTTLTKALEWAIRSVKLLDSYQTNDTLAHLYRVTGDMDKARKYAQAALNQAKDEGQSTAELENFLNSLK